jgi:hypothetical protein
MAITPKYVSIPTFHRYLNEILGMKIGLNKIYSEVNNGNIRSAFIAGKHQIIYSELEDYGERKLLEAKGIPTAHAGTLGKKVTLNG